MLPNAFLLTRVPYDRVGTTGNSILSWTDARCEQLVRNDFCCIKYFSPWFAVLIVLHATKTMLTRRRAR